MSRTFFSSRRRTGPASGSNIARRPTWSSRLSAKKIDRTTSRKSGSSTPWPAFPSTSIVDPEEELITVFVLKSRQRIYGEFGTFRKGELAASKLLRGFTVDVTEDVDTKTLTPGHERPIER